MDKLVVLQTKWQTCWGETVRVPGGKEYKCSKDGDMSVSEVDAKELLTTSGWRRKPSAPIKKQPLGNTPKPSEIVETEENVENSKE